MIVLTTATARQWPQCSEEEWQQRNGGGSKSRAATTPEGESCFDGPGEDQSFREVDDGV